MKPILAIIALLFAANISLAQNTSGIRAKMTENFSDTLKLNIQKAITDNYDIELWYQSPVDPEGRLIKPLITKQINNNDINYDPFIQQMRLLITEAPVWVPAFDSNGGQVQGSASFHIKIYRGDITIEDWLEDR